ncbi:autotransporter family protein [Trinickia sp.]|uniref:autotransporter family protein n=1 Tax=Trinickia sp. TaxID=2571163 RepID=UPI003F822B26
MRHDIRFQSAPGRRPAVDSTPHQLVRTASSFRPKTTTLAVLGYIALVPALAQANCSTVGTATTCDSTAPSPWTTMIGTGSTTASGSTVTVGPNAQISLGDSSAIALSDNATVTVQAGAVVKNAAVNTGGTYGTGGNTIDFRNNSTLTVEQGGTVLSGGTQGSAEAVNPEGTGNTIINNGTIRGINSAAIWFQNTSGSNTVINSATGVIQAPGNVMGASGNGAVVFTNSGQVIGNLVFAGGNDTLNLETGSTVSGSIDGGGGNNLLTLGGTGTDTLPTRITRFQTLQKQDSGTWTITNSIAGMGLTSAEVQQGTLVLTGNNSTYTGTMLVDQAGTLQASAQSLTNAVTDNGLVRFQQDTAGTYAGLISGTGAVEKDGAGTLTLAPSAPGGNAYTGGTILHQGVLSVAADNALGGTAGGVTFDGGTLQLGSAFNLANSRAISITSNGGTIDTQGFQSTISQRITGSGALAKTGSGTLVLNGANTYSGMTSVAAGTLVVGDASNTGASIAGPATVGTGTTLGGYGTVGGDVTNNGTIAVANALSSASVSANAPGSFTIHGQLTNAGLVQVGGNGQPGNTLNVGSYVGNNGTIALNTTLGADNSASDKVVVNGGTATGSTTLKVTNVGGKGAPTTSSGIEVVQATGGATSSASAFTLAGGTIKAGAYAYYLAKGGVTPGTSEDWYLRNTVPATSSGIAAATGAAAGSPALPAASATPITLYRPEVALYSQIPPVMRELDTMQLDEFHLRQGDQMLLNEQGRLPAGWGRVWGAHSVLSEGGDVNPQFDGTMGGAQVGHDIYADGVQGGHRNHYGFYVGMGRATGDVNGSAIGLVGVNVGHLSVNEYSLAGYWTHIGPTGWYTDTVVQGSALNADSTSSDNVHASTHGTAISASVEAGMPLAIGHGITMEPEAQVIYQHLSIKDLNDGVSQVSFGSGNSVLARFGVRFAGNWDALGVAWQPYMSFNVLHAFANGDHQTYDGATSIATSVNQTTGRIDAGLVTKFSKHGSAFATVSWGTNLDGEHVRSIGGDAGVRWSW